MVRVKALIAHITIGNHFCDRPTRLLSIRAYRYADGPRPALHTTKIMCCHMIQTVSLVGYILITQLYCYLTSLPSHDGNLI